MVCIADAFLTDYVYKAKFKGMPSGRFYRATEIDVWFALQTLEAYGLEREYAPTKRELKKMGWSVHKYKLVEVK